MARGKAKPVSGPGKLSERTDKSQPVRVPTGGDYGDAKALGDQQKSAPLANASANQSGGSPPAGGPPQSGAVSPPPAGGVFGPTTRPGESSLAGLPPEGTAPGDADLVLRNIYAQFPHPQILKLLRRSRQNQQRG